MKRFFLLFLLLSIFSKNLFAQKDSSNTSVIRLGTENLLPPPKDSIRQVIISDTRSVSYLDESPNLIFIITKEDIQKFACQTLVDVMKLVPGVRASSSGSALNGEMFMINGVLGNENMKILINDVPLRPFLTKGVSIGHQLPIRQAERIEIVMGASTAIYGDDASVGVINIILQESERPIYAQAELNFGSQRFRNTEVSFGGKLGKGKDILKFSCYGGYTNFNDRNVKGNTNLYNSSLYDRDTFIEQSIFQDKNQFDQYRQFLSILPHNSNHFGVDLKFKQVQVSYREMFRQDASMLGLNPFAVIYKKGSNYADRTQILSFTRFGRKDKKAHWDYWANVKNYTLDSESSLNFINSKEFIFMKKKFKQYKDNLGLWTTELDYLNIYNKNFRGERFAKASAYDVNLGFGYINKLSEKFTFYTNFNTSIGWGGNTYFDEPTPRANEEINLRYAQLSAALSSTLKYNYKRWKASISISGLAVTELLTPSIYSKSSISYNILENKPLWAFATFGNGVKVFNWQNVSNSKSASSINSISRLSNFYIYNNNEDYINNMENKNLNLGIKSKRLGLFYTYNRFRNIISYFPILNISEGGSSLSESANAFVSKPNSFIQYQSFTTYIYFTNRKSSFKKKIFPFPVDWSINYTYAFGKENGKKYIAHVPKYQLQNNFGAELTKNFSFNAVHNFSSSIYDNFRGEKAKFYNVFDVILFYRFNQNLNAQLCMRNLFNADYSGIAASGTEDDLLYNPQSLRTVQFGLTYSLK